MSAHSDRRQTMAIPIAPVSAASPRERRRRPVLYALLVALLTCLGGGILVSTDSSPDARPRKHGTTRPHPAPTATQPPNGPRLMGIVEDVDTRYDRLVIGVHGHRLAYGLHAQTLYPDSCLQAATLRRGQRVTLTLPWYMGGQDYVQAITPAGGCGL